jgi:hypothetical protein
MFGRAGRVMESLLNREVRRWQRASGGVVHLIRPNRDIAALAKTPLDLFNNQLAKEAYPLAREQVGRLLESCEALAALVAGNLPVAA